ncbi:MAG TPA: hypothetical protein VGN20_20055 [Mucilaginibacter sp.]|jgi:hypothetical protein
MTTIQLKSEIKKVLEQVPEKALPDVLDFLKELQAQPEDGVQLVNFLTRTLIEDRELLKKLAE